MSEYIAVGPKMPKIAERKGSANAAAEEKAGIERNSDPIGNVKASEGPRKDPTTGSYAPAEYPTHNGLTRRDR